MCLTKVIELLCAAILLHPIVIQKQRRPIQVSALSKNSGKQPFHKYCFRVGLIQKTIVYSQLFRSCKRFGQGLETNVFC